ncbi:hypothetical protein DFJ73DRAFT_955823 [Zopfochytrium polystomum]|nr:hypothetical protein DFJ73DRAFT_955823 [Zopfochytrium polystomum]
MCRPDTDMDPAVLALLSGVLLSKTSPLRVLRRDRDAVVLLITTLRDIRAHHVDWSQPGVWPSLARIEFPPPLVRGFPMSKPRPPNTHERYHVDMSAGFNFFDHWNVDGEDRRIRENMWTLWKDLEAWAVANGHVKPGAEEEMDAGGEFTLLGRRLADRIPDGQQRLVEALGDLVEPLHVNMLPIKMGRHESLPLKCRRYSALVNRCLFHCPEEMSQIGYLTIHEGWVEPGQSQRRPGLHVESPGYYKINEDDVNDSGEFKQKLHHWGFGIGPDVWHIEGGVFQASNLGKTCRVWNCVIRDHGDIVGPLGDLEHLRHRLNRGPPREASAPDSSNAPAQNSSAVRSRGGRRQTPAPRRPRRGETLEANTIAWMTDRTPHESVPIGFSEEEEGEGEGEGEGGAGGNSRRRVFRQYFRLVTSRVTAWYEMHSTRNDECGVQPPNGVVVVQGDKFEAVGSSGMGHDGWRPLSFL